MKVKIELKNGRKVQKNIEKIPTLGIEGISDALFIGSNDIRNRAIKSMRDTERANWFYKRGRKRHHPSKPGSPAAIDSGELVRSLIVARQQKLLRTKITVGVTGGAPYAKYLEDPKGTKYMKARPFLAPAYQIELPALRRLIARMAYMKIIK